MKQSVLLLLLLLISYFHFGGSRQGEPAYLGLYKKAEQLYNAENPTEESDSIAFDTYSRVIKLLEKNQEHDSLLVDCYTKAAVIKQMKGDDPSSIQLFLKALNVFERNKTLSDSQRFLPLVYCGSSYYTLQQFDSARYYYLKAEAVLDRHPNLPERERLFNKIGTLFYEEGNFHQSLNYFTKAFSLLDTADAANHPFMVNYYNNIAVTYKKLGRYQEALNAYRFLLRYRINRDGLMHNLATVYLDLNQPEESLKYLHAIGTSSQQLYNNIALAHLKLEHPDSAAIYLEKAFGSRTHNFKTTVNGLSWYYSGMLQEQRKNYDEALKMYQRSIVELDADFDNLNTNANPGEFQGAHSFTDLFNSLAAKARLLQLMYTTNKNVQLLEASLQSWESALLLARTVQQGYEADESRLFLNNNLQPASEEAATTALLLYQAKPSKSKLEKIFELAEASKAAVLQIRIQQSSIASLPNMPADLLNQQKTQRILLARLQVQYEQTTDTAVLTSLQQQIRDQQIRLSEINTKLNNDPAYINASVTSSLKTTDVQKNLPEHMSMLAYYFIRDKWLAFVLRKDSLFLQLLPVDKDHLFEVRNQLQVPSISATQLQPSITRLHRWLVQPLLHYLQNSKRLIIIPDHDLQYIPFEILANDNGKTLLEDFAISYDYSAAFAGITEKKSSASSQQMGLAPFGGKRAGYPGNFLPLPASSDEISVLKGLKLSDSSATKQAFIRNASSYTTIHLATHAAANDQQPENSFIAFYPLGTDTSYKLYQPEIYNLDLHKTQLVILSACETGHGQFVHGEGMMSLARAFSYAGCKSVITSLWKADDASTAYITKRLHLYLREGKTKDVALQRAKLDYMADESIAARFKTPAYWSHLVLIGNAAPLYHPSSLWWIALLAAAIIAAAAVAYLKKRRQ
ncbi:MAG: CHAT domain-containing tetratricopeptide repeat protein [Chitinophagaceae bacterium]